MHTNLRCPLWTTFILILKLVYMTSFLSIANVINLNPFRISGPTPEMGMDSFRVEMWGWLISNLVIKDHW